MGQDPRFNQVDAAVVPRFADVATFMRTRRHDIDKAIDIGLIGVPFDLGVNYRSGARQGPAGIREASRLIRRVHPTSGISPFETCNVADLGDTPINPLSLDDSIAKIETFFSQVHAAGIRPIGIGGDHTIPIPILRGIAKDRPVGMLHIDAHPDTLDELCGTRINHATFLRRANEEGLIDPKRIVQVGLRGSRFSDHDLEYGYDVGYTIITMDEYEEMGRAEAIRRVLDTVGDGPTYVSLDIDGLDPTYAPGTGVPEIGGLLPRDVQVMIRALQGRDIVGADISEVAPCFDPTGITCVTAANLMFEILCVMAHAVTARS
jgi:guanidinopropionase